MTIDKETYQVVVRQKIEAVDTLDARELAEEFIYNHDLDYSDCEIKLQRLNDGKPPEGIPLPFLENE